MLFKYLFIYFMKVVPTCIMQPSKELLVFVVSSLVVHLLAQLAVVVVVVIVVA